VASAQRNQTDSQSSFVDSSGTVWSVEERQRPGKASSTERMLVFGSSSAFRCVRHYPENWLDLAPEALERLSWNS
jgi:hypothetical protein